MIDRIYKLGLIVGLLNGKAVTVSYEQLNERIVQINPARRNTPSGF